MVVGAVTRERHQLGGVGGGVKGRYGSWDNPFLFEKRIKAQPYVSVSCLMRSGHPASLKS